MNCVINDARIIYEDGKPIGVVTYWTDGTKTKAITEMEDRENFNLDFGITICLTKKMIKFLQDHGMMEEHETYMRAVATVRKWIEQQERAEEEKKEAERKERAARHEAKLKEAQKRRAAREREIEIQKEAYLRALREFHAENGGV